MAAFPRAVIWDLDGTLVDSAPDLAAAANALLREDGRRALDLEAVKRMTGEGAARLVARAWVATGAPAEGSDLARLVDRFVEIYAAGATRRTALYPGVADALSGLAARGVAQGICTNKPEAISRAIVEHLGVGDVFVAVIGGDSTDRKKPDPLPLLACAERLGAGAADAVFIGDSRVDAETGRAAGMPVVLVSYGYAREPVPTLGADAVIDHPADLPRALAALARAA